MIDAESPLPERIGPYRISGRLGTGGMGEVLSGHDDRLDRPVALKCIRPGARDPEKARRRFRREARAVARLSHSAIVQVYDWVETDGQDWLVMELVEGRTLHELLAGGPLPPERAAAIARDVASGLAVAHEAGVVHRDLKAANVIVTPSGAAKILDFGIAKAVEVETVETGKADLRTTLTDEGQVIGTVAAMSPEQALGRPVDHRSDLFSLGTLLYEMLSGVSPFEGENAVETLTRICTAKEQPLRRLDPQVPEGLSRLVGHLLEKEPSRRPTGAQQVVTELDRLATSGAGSDTAETLAAPSQRETLRDGARARSRSVVSTLVLSDLVDSTRLVERLGDERAAAVFEQHDRLARRLMAEHEGREVDKSDGFLLLFTRPLAAVRYALAYHAALAELAERAGVELVARVGIHVGEVVVRENDAADVARGAKPLEVEGLAKAMAARFMGLARGGQTLISRSVYDMARRAAVGAESLPEGLVWAEHGRYRMKGVEDQVGVFEVGAEGVAPLVAPADSEKVVRVVEASDTYAIRKVFGRWVLAAAAVLLTTIGLWGMSSWLRPPVEVAPDGGAAGMAAQPPETELNSHDLYQRGMALLERYDKKGNIGKAIADFQRALALDENYAPALAGLASAYRLDYFRGSRDPQRLAQALAAAEQAVQADEYLAVARTSLGMVYCEMGRYEEAVRELERALQIEPLNGDARYGIGKVAEARAKLPQAEELFLRAIDAQPGNWVFHSHLGSLYYNAGRYEEAEAAFLHHIELTPDSFVAFRNLGATYYMEGRLAEAATQFQQALQIQPEPTVYSNLGTIYFAQGLYAQSVSAFEKAIESGGSNDYRQWANLGDAYRWTPDNEAQAREAYLRTLQLLTEKLAQRPQDANLRTLLPQYLAKRGDCDQALGKMATLGDLPDDDATSWYQLAVANEICDRRTEALAALEVALKAGYPMEEVRGDPELLKLRQDVRYQRLTLQLQPPSGD